MEEKKQPDKSIQKNTPPSLIDIFLLEQQNLTAVDRFSETHSKCSSLGSGQTYRSLIPNHLPGTGQQFAFEVDLDSCSGCKACVTGCHTKNGLDLGESWRNVGLIHGEESSRSKSDAVNFGLSGKLQVHASAPNFFQQHITGSCHHCAEPTCLKGCPVNAYEKDKVTGVVKHLDDQCIGCKYCVFTCSYGVPQFNERLGIVRKCDMCVSRLESMEAPACVQSCPNEAIRIAIVDIKEIEANPSRHFNVPSLPDAHYSKPATQYKTKKKIPSNALAQDHWMAQPQPKEYPLVFMLVFTQASVGMLLSAFLSDHFFQTESSSLFMVETMAALFLGGLGVLISLLHLGRPQYAYKVFLGLKNSWLSREAVAFGHYLLLVLLSAYFSHSILTGLALGVGVLGVYSSAMVYKNTPRVQWSSHSTLGKFAVTTLLLGGSLSLALEISWGRLESISFWFSWIFAACLAKGLIEISQFNHFKKPLGDPFRKTAEILMSTFRSFTVWRFASLFLGWVGTLFLFFGHKQYGTVNITIVWVSFVFLLCGECLERVLFFVSAVPPKMPGLVSQELNDEFY